MRSMGDRSRSSSTSSAGSREPKPQFLPRLTTCTRHRRRVQWAITARRSATEPTRTAKRLRAHAGNVAVLIAERLAGSATTTLSRSRPAISSAGLASGSCIDDRVYACVVVVKQGALVALHVLHQRLVEKSLHSALE